MSDDNIRATSGDDDNSFPVPVDDMMVYMSPSLSTNATAFSIDSLIKSRDLETGSRSSSAADVEFVDDDDERQNGDDLLSRQTGNAVAAEGSKHEKG